MPLVCAAVGCKEVISRSAHSLHKFPRDPVLRKAWAVKVNREVRDPVTGRRMLWMPKNHDGLCSAHFEENCFTLRTRLMKNMPGMNINSQLLPDAVPSIFKHNLKKRIRSEMLAKKRTVVAKRQRLEIIAEALNRGDVKTGNELLTKATVPIMNTDKSSSLLTPWAALKNPNILPQKFQSFTSEQFENEQIKKEPLTEAALFQPLASGYKVNSLIQCNCGCVKRKRHDLDAPELKFELKTEEDDLFDKTITTETDIKSDKTMLSHYFNIGEWKVEVNANKDCESDEELKNLEPIDVKCEMPEVNNASIETAQQLGRENPEVNVKTETEKTDQHFPLLDKVKVKKENGADICDREPSRTQSCANEAVPTTSDSGKVPSPQCRMVILLRRPGEGNCTVPYMIIPPKPEMVVRYMKIPIKPSSGVP